MQFKQSVDDRRVGGRIASQIRVIVMPREDDRQFEGWSRNVSVTGLALNFEIPHQYLQQNCTVRIILSGQHSDLVIDKLEGVIVRAGKRTAAVTFLKPLEWFLLFSVYQKKFDQALQNQAG